ncbi:MAG: CVNH domain-containing protein [Iphinoe sp. HA4291-MV1]|jgi:exo-beta-1,3-glucanase (GH17 family)|nr:CVNH domain-containing protein [Iphinoe sp. HA4291-MV1]
MSLLKKVTLTACCTILAAIPLDIALSSPTSSSTYQSSCSKISVSGATLSASCRRKNGKFKSTSILIRGIENNDGNLSYFRSTSPSTYQSSCSKISVSGATLSASCRRKNGKFKSTSILIRGIENNDGNLSYL